MVLNYQDILSYFDNDTLRTDVFINKYALIENNLAETPAQMFHRLAKELHKVESDYKNPLSYDYIYSLIADFKYLILGGSSMYGIGNNESYTSLSNCFYLGNNGVDSYGSIMKMDEQLVQLMKRRGGVGIDISHLRPKGAKVTNAAKTSSGAVSFMNRFSNSTREVAQEGRRGALMISIDVRHPDSHLFIKAKEDRTKITGANISVKITDEFMQAVINNKQFATSFPIGSENITYINANKLWEELITQAHENAEPGVLFWDTAKRNSPSDLYEGYEIKGVNPCFAGDELLLTDKGNKTFAELAKEEFIYIYNKNGELVKSKVWLSGDKNVITLVNTLKETIKCTPDHVWLTTDNKEVQAKDLKGHSLMPYLDKTLLQDELFLKLGFIQGDGNLSRLNKEKYTTHKGFEINIGQDDEEVLDLFGYEIVDNSKPYSYYTTEFFDICKTLEFSETISTLRKLPNTYKSWTNIQKTSFLSGLFSANGCIIRGKRISLKSTSLDLINDLIVALKEFDINCYVTVNKPTNVIHRNGIYKSKLSYDLNIGKYNEMYKFYNTIRFIHKYKNDHLKRALITKSPTIIKVIDNKEVIPVYDFTEPLTNWGVVNNYIAHNCGEILLSDFECCRLASINLINFVDNPYTEDAIFRTEHFKEVVYNSQKLMDDIVNLDIKKMHKILEKLDKDRGTDYSEYNVEFDLWIQILKKAIDGRRTGLGITGLGDTLAAMGYTYSSEANNFIALLFKEFAVASYKASIDMAENRKAFKNCKPELEIKHHYLSRIYKELPVDYQVRWKKYGRRNIANLTVAPNGSISILANVTSGIEPVFELEYKRKRKVDIKDETTTTDANGDHWKTYTVLHKGFDNYLTINNLKEDYYSNEMSKKLVLERSPYYNSTANTLNPIDKVKIQGIIQNWIDHSISVTHNLPKDITKEEVSQIYIEAWKNGCKGCTIYREGSRDGVLVRDTTKEVKHESSFKQHTAIKRPKELFCKLHPIKVDKKDYIVSVGLIENKPFEIFIFPREGEFIEQAICRKMIRGSYNIVMLNGKTIYKDIVKSSGNYGSITRLISLAFRHGAEVRFVVDQLSKDEGDFNSVFKALARVLKEYIKTGAIVTGKQCPECKQDTLIYEQGCHRCTNCGYNGCS